MTETSIAEEIIFDEVRSFYEGDELIAESFICVIRENIPIMYVDGSPLEADLEGKIIDASKKLMYAELATSPYSFIREFAKYGRRN